MEPISLYHLERAVQSLKDRLRDAEADCDNVLELADRLESKNQSQAQNPLLNARDRDQEAVAQLCAAALAFYQARPGKKATIEEALRDVPATPKQKVDAYDVFSDYALNYGLKVVYMAGFTKDYCYIWEVKTDAKAEEGATA